MSDAADEKMIYRPCRYYYNYRSIGALDITLIFCYNYV